MSSLTCPQGSLRHFLGQHVGTWAGSVRLALSLARGLAFLHQELWRDGEGGTPGVSPALSSSRP